MGWGGCLSCLSYQAGLFSVAYDQDSGHCVFHIQNLIAFTTSRVDCCNIFYPLTMPGNGSEYGVIAHLGKGTSYSEYSEYMLYKAILLCDAVVLVLLSKSVNDLGCTYWKENLSLQLKPGEMFTLNLN